MKRVIYDKPYRFRICLNKDKASCAIGCANNGVDSNFGICMSFEDLGNIREDLAKVKLFDDAERIVRFMKSDQQSILDQTKHELEVVEDMKKELESEILGYRQMCSELGRYRDLWRRFVENPKPVSFVYIYLDLDAKLVKIGKSDNPNKRVSSYKSSSGNLGRLYAILECALEEVQETEQEIHDQLEEYNTHGEWYKVPPDVMTAILKKYKFDILINTPLVVLLTPTVLRKSMVTT